MLGCKTIAEQVKLKYNDQFDNIYGVPRGGLVIAVYLSHLLDLPVVDSIRDGRTLIVDDIADTGKTLVELDKFKYSKIATLYYHEQSMIYPDIWVYLKTDKWIQFPWEVK